MWHADTVYILHISVCVSPHFNVLWNSLSSSAVVSTIRSSMTEKYDLISTRHKQICWVNPHIIFSISTYYETLSLNAVVSLLRSRVKTKYVQWRRQRSKAARSFRGQDILEPGHPVALKTQRPPTPPRLFHCHKK